MYVLLESMLQVWCHFKMCHQVTLSEPRFRIFNIKFASNGVSTVCWSSRPRKQLAATECRLRLPSCGQRREVQSDLSSLSCSSHCLCCIKSLLCLLSSVIIGFILLSRTLELVLPSVCTLECFI